MCKFNEIKNMKVLYKIKCHVGHCFFIEKIFFHNIEADAKVLEGLLPIKHIDYEFCHKIPTETKKNQRSIETAIMMAFNQPHGFSQLIPKIELMQSIISKDIFNIESYLLGKEIKLGTIILL